VEKRKKKKKGSQWAQVEFTSRERERELFFFRCL
jgi:hypothetical protein